MAVLLPCSAIDHAGTCDTLDACLAMYPTVAIGEPGISPEEQELAKAVLSHGAAAIPGLIKLLESDQTGVSALAAFTLRDIQGLKPEHLPALIKARENGDGWIPPAIARIGTPEAIQFLVNDLRRRPETNTQVTWALASLGAKAAPGVAGLLRCSAQCDEDVLHAAIAVIGEMKNAGLAAVPLLLGIAGDDRLAMIGRRAAVAAIGAIGPPAAACVPQLRALMGKAPGLAAAVESTLAELGTSAAVPSLLRLLATDPAYALRQLRGLGRNGVTAGPTVMEYLESADWGLRIDAADALGHLGYAPAELGLRKALENQDDWKLVLAAAIALANMNAKSSIAALRQVESAHWYPPVRDVARAAILQLESGKPLKEPLDWKNGEIPGSPESCIQVQEPAAEEPRDRKRQMDDDSGKLFDLAVSTRNGGAKSGVVPNVALKVADGWLTGTDSGEWGGQLMLQSPQGTTHVITEANVQNLFSLGQQTVAVTGLAHMGFNGGMLLRINSDGRGSYTATPWKRLPAAPDTSWLLESGKVLVNTRGGGSVVIDVTGNLRMAECL